MKQMNETVRGMGHSVIVKVTDHARTITVMPEGAQQGEVIEANVDGKPRAFRGSQPVTLEEPWRGEPVEPTYLQKLDLVNARRIYARPGWELLKWVRSITLLLVSSEGLEYLARLSTC